MVRVTVTDNLQRHVHCRDLNVTDGSLADVLTEVFAQWPELEPYVLNEQKQLRPHIMLAVDQSLIQGNFEDWRSHRGFQRLHIMQALSGG